METRGENNDRDPMKVVENDLIPFKGFTAMNICGLVFVRREKWNTLSGLRQDFILQHEAIHTAQMRELGFIGFYIIYLLEWIYRLIFHTKTAYRGISFEREAYSQEHNYFYIYQRKPFAQWRKE